MGALFQDGLADWTVGRNITLTLTWLWLEVILKKGSLESETVKYGRESHGTRTREWMRCRGPAEIVNIRPIVSSERMIYKEYGDKCSIEKNILAVSLKGRGAKTNLLAVNRQS
jgi:hypothetical protein